MGSSAESPLGTVSWEGQDQVHPSKMISGLPVESRGRAGQGEGAAQVSAMGEAPRGPPEPGTYG